MTLDYTTFSNTIRDVAPDFDTMVAESPSFLKMLGSLSTSYDFLTGQQIVTNNKHEWIDDTLSAYSSAIASFDTDGDGTGINVADTTGFVAGSIVRFESSTGASKTEKCQIVSVDSSTDLTVTRDYGSTTGVTLVTGDVMILESTPYQKGSSAPSSINHQGTAAYNYTQIFREAAELTNTDMVSLTYDKSNLLARQEYAAMVRMARNIENAVIHGVPVARSSTVKGTMGGILNAISGGNAVSVGGAISQSAINNIFEDIYQDGGESNNYVILCSTNQARKITALNTSGSNPVVYKPYTPNQQIGEFVTRFVGDLPVLGGGLSAGIYVCQSMLKDQIAILDMNKIKLAVMRGLTATDATTPGDDGYKSALATELTLEYRNANQAHGLLTSLTV